MYLTAIYKFWPQSTKIYWNPETLDRCLRRKCKKIFIPLLCCYLEADCDRLRWKPSFFLKESACQVSHWNNKSLTFSLIHVTSIRNYLKNDRKSAFTQNFCPPSCSCSQKYRWASNNFSSGKTLNLPPKYGKNCLFTQLLFCGKPIRCFVMTHRAHCPATTPLMACWQKFARDIRSKQTWENMVDSRSEENLIEDESARYLHEKQEIGW